MTHLQACEMVSRWYPAHPTYGHQQQGPFGGMIQASSLACLQESWLALDTALITLFCNTLWATGSFLECLFHADISTLQACHPSFFYSQNILFLGFQ